MPTLGVISLHTSPLAQPGSGDSGGMNVFVRELASSLAHAGVSTQVFVRKCSEELPDVVDVEPGVQVVHIPAGPLDLDKEKLPEIVDEFADAMEQHLGEHPVDVFHANYWLSGEVGHTLKHRLDIPLVSTFHTLARVKAATGDREPHRRVASETQVVSCSDAITASCATESTQLQAHYGADASRIEIVAPGVDHAFFSPGNRSGARRALGLPDDVPILLFVGRVQPLKGLPIAIEALSHLRTIHPDARLLVVGGPSGPAGAVERARCVALADELKIAHAIRWVAPQPHHALSTYYRAANVMVVPSRSESFGLVALEAAACGIPVVAAAVGGLTSIVQDGQTGTLVDSRDATQFAAAIEPFLNDPVWADHVGCVASMRAREYSWSRAAARLRRVYADLVNRVPASCQ